MDKAMIDSSFATELGQTEYAQAVWGFQYRPCAA